MEKILIALIGIVMMIYAFGWFVEHILPYILTYGLIAAAVIGAIVAIAKLAKDKSN